LRFCLDPFLAHPKRFVYTRTGERDRALEQLEKVATVPTVQLTASSASIGAGILCADLRFDKIVAAAKAASNNSP